MSKMDDLIVLRTHIDALSNQSSKTSSVLGTLFGDMHDVISNLTDYLTDHGELLTDQEKNDLLGFHSDLSDKYAYLQGFLRDIQGWADERWVRMDNRIYYMEQEEVLCQRREQLVESLANVEKELINLRANLEEQDSGERAS